MALTYQNGFARPPDVPAYVAQPIVYASGATATIIGDGAGTRGSPMPILASQLGDIPSFATGWLVSGDPPTTGAGIEPKFRFHLNPSHILPDDPIRNYGQPGASHLHQFFGNTGTNAFSTFSSLRTRANQMSRQRLAASTSPGGPYNGTGYWVPAMLDGSGNVITPYLFFGYYTNNSAAVATKTQRLPLGLRYVFGFNMDDPTNSVETAQLAAANALPGNSGRYSVAGDEGFLGWFMLTPDGNTVIQTALGQDSSPWLRNLDGSDPWGGAGYAGCLLKATLSAPTIYDGVNLWSPGGYDHLRRAWNDANTGALVGPQGHYHVPKLQLYPFYLKTGVSDHLGWRLSSDDHAAMGLPGGVCQNGRSMHADWLGAWPDKVFGASTGWQMQCTAAANGETPRECASGCFDSAGTRILGSINGDNAPDGSRMPQIDFTPRQFLNPIPSSFTGPLTLPVHSA